ncbi:MAG TPA: site-specific recombinase, partial [Streptosporangiaceae bacterium]
SAAADRYLAQAGLGAASRRVYRISLASWAWPLVGKPTPRGAGRRGAVPIVPLALLDEPGAGPRLTAAVADRAATAGARTVNRELSVLRGAVAWWQDQRWIHGDPTAGLRHLPGPRQAQGPLTAAQVSQLFRLRCGLREHAFWQLVYDTGAPAADLLSLDIGGLDLAHRRGRVTAPPVGRWICWTAAATSDLLGWLVAGRPEGPVFVTDRRAPGHTARADRCLVTGRARMSYRRAAELFTAATAPLDPAGRGWTLHQLQQAGRLAHGQAP